MAKLTNSLTFLRQDVHREKKNRILPVYLLDFSDLYAYLWPDLSRSQHKAVINYLLESSDLRFSLPPGALLELYAHLEEQQAKHRRAGRSVSDTLSRPIVSAFVESLRKQPVPERVILPQVPTTTTLLEAIAEVTRSDRALTRLRDLYDRKRLEPLEDHASSEETMPDAKVFHSALYQLRVARHGRPDITNVIDAHNYATVVRLNDLCYVKKRKFFLLVTSSPTPHRIFDTLKWENDPDYPAEIEPVIQSSLVRHPVQLLYRAHLATVPQPRRLLHLDRALSDLRTLRSDLTSVAAYRRYKDGRVEAQTPVQLPRNRMFLARMARFAKFYWDVYRPTADLLATDESLEYNRRLLRHVSTERIGGTPWTFDESESASAGQESLQPLLMTYRSAIGLFDRVIEQSRWQLAKLGSEVRKLTPSTLRTIDPDGLFVAPDNILVEKTPNVEDGSIEVGAVLEGQHRVNYLNADVFPRYLAAWWRTNASFQEFLTAASQFLTARDQERRTSGKPEKPDGHPSRAYSGVTFVTDDDVISRPLDPESDLTAQVLSLAEPQWALRFVRISAPDADLCYDVAPLHPFPQRAGIITDGDYGDAALTFVRWTNSVFVQERPVAKALREIFASISRGAA